MTLRKTFEGDLKKMELPRVKQGIDHCGEEEMAPLSPTDRGNQRRLAMNKQYWNQNELEEVQSFNISRIFD